MPLRPSLVFSRAARPPLAFSRTTRPSLASPCADPARTLTGTRPALRSRPREQIGGELALYPRKSERNLHCHAFRPPRSRPRVQIGVELAVPCADRGRTCSIPAQIGPQLALAHLKGRFVRIFDQKCTKPGHMTGFYAAHLRKSGHYVQWRKLRVYLHKPNGHKRGRLSARRVSWEPICIGPIADDPFKSREIEASAIASAGRRGNAARTKPG